MYVKKRSEDPLISVMHRGGFMDTKKAKKVKEQITRRKEKGV